MSEQYRPLVQRDDESRKQKLSDLVRERRSKFPYIDLTTGKINSNWRVLLVALGNLTGIPILFSLGLTAYNLYLYNDVTPQDFLPVTFIGIALFIFIDPIFGFIYDRIDHRHKSVVQKVLLVLGALGLLITQGFLLKGTIKNPSLTVNFALGFALFSYSLINTSSIKKSFSLTPSQKSRKSLLYFEGVIGAIALFVLVGIPFIIKNGTDECQCDTSCVIMQLDECRICLEACQSFANSRIFQVTTIICTVAFILFNFLALWLISPRNDYRESPPLYSFNKRIFDFLKNSLLTSTSFIYFLEALILFTLVMWVGFYGFRQFDAPGICIATNKIDILCTVNDYLVLLMLVVPATAVVVALLTLFDSINLLWQLSTIFSFFAGICIINAGADTKGIFIVVLVATAVSYSILPTSKAYFSDATYYDEYRTGYVLLHYLTFIFNLATKLAFLMAAANIISHTDVQIYRAGVQETHNVNYGAGTLIIFAAIILVIMKIRLRRFQLKVFDKIQVAIQKNRSDASADENITFTDPITNQPIRRPLILKPHEDVRGMLYLDNFARSSEFERATRERYGSLKKEGTIVFFVSFFLVVLSAVLVGLFHKTFVKPQGWILLVPLLILTFGLYVMIYSANVRTTASILMSEEKIDKDYLNKYLFYRKQQDLPL